MTSLGQGKSGCLRNHLLMDRPDWPVTRFDSSAYPKRIRAGLVDGEAQAGPRNPRGSVMSSATGSIPGVSLLKQSILSRHAPGTSPI